MKKKWSMFVVIAVVCCGIMFGAGYGVGATSSGTPGSASDPLVTKSYVDKYASNASKSKGGDSSFKQVTLSSGQSIKGSVGTEIVLVTGSGSSNGGLINLSKEKNLSKGDKVNKCANCIITKQNGGFKAKKKTKILVKGSYNVN